jgi:O-antigen/teichoic acid export membrane protein
VLVYSLQGVLEGSLVSDERAISVLLILIVLAPLSALDGLMMGMFAVFSRPRAIFFRKYVLTPGLRLTVVLLLVLGGQSVFFLAAGYVATAAFGVALYGVLLHRMLRDEGLLDRLREGGVQVPAREVLGFTIPLLTSDLVYMTMNTSDVILLGHYGGATDVAAFRVIGPTAHLNQLVMTSFTLLFTPLAARMFARHDREGINQLYWQTAVWIAVLSFPLFALTFSLADPVTVTLFGERYESSAVYLTLLSLGYYFNAALGFNGLTLKVYGRLRYIVSINILAALVNVGVNIILIPRYGALGAAIGTCGTLILHNILKQAGLRFIGIGLFRRADLRVYVSIVAAAAALLALQLALDPPAVVSFVFAALASLVVIAVSRSSLRAAQTFPELMRFRLMRLIVGS